MHSTLRLLRRGSGSSQGEQGVSEIAGGRTLHTLEPTPRSVRPMPPGGAAALLANCRARVRSGAWFPPCSVREPETSHTSLEDEILNPGTYLLTLNSSASKVCQPLCSPRPRTALCLESMHRLLQNSTKGLLSAEFGES